MKKAIKMKQILTGLTLMMALSGCKQRILEKDDISIESDQTIIENATYRATLSDRNGDHLNDALKIERKLPTSYGSKEPMVEYFVTSLPREPSLSNGEVVNLVGTEFFRQYEELFNPNRDLIITTYK